MKFYYTTRTYMVKHIIWGHDDMTLIGYEEKFDQLALILKDDYEYGTSVEVDAGFIVDLDKKGNICAIEIIGCAEQLDVSKDYVRNADIEVFAEEFEYSYKLTVEFNGKKKITKRLLK